MQSSLSKALPEPPRRNQSLYFIHIHIYGVCIFFSPITKHEFSLHKAFQTATLTGIKINPRMAFPVKQTNLVSFIFFFQVTSLLAWAESSPQTLGGHLKELLQPEHLSITKS